MNLKIEERKISVEEIVDAHKGKRLRECFGTGTAATVSHIKRIHYRGQDLILPDVEHRTVGPAVRQRLIDIMTGRVKDPYGWTDRV